MAEDLHPESHDEPTLARMPTVPDEHAAPTQPAPLSVPLPQASLPQASSYPAPPGMMRVPGTYPDYSHDPYSNVPSAVRERDVRRRVRRKRKSGSEWAWVIVAAALFGVTLVVSLSLFIILRSVNDPQTVAVLPTAVVVVPTTVPNLELFGNTTVGSSSGGGPGGEPQANEQGVIIEPWDGEQRFTILVMGWDRRPGEGGNAFRTDTMLLVSIDPETSSIGVLSIPRDLYVEVPGYNQLQRVNSAFVLGELQRPGYGPQLTMQTVQYNLGIRVNDYLLVDFNTFITLVDLIGGIDVDVPYTINDPQYPNMYYGYDPFYLTAGLHHLDGETALKYARTRHGSNDFRRAERQQQVLFAIRDRILSLDMLPQLIINAPALWGQVQAGVQTGLTLDQMLRLAWYLKDIPGENIHSGVIDENYISFYTTPSGASVVVPRRSQIGPLMVEVFGPNYNQ